MFSRFSKDLFSSWTRSIINCGLVNIFLSVILGIFAVFLFNYAATPFDYIICSEPLIKNKVLSYFVGNIELWAPKGAVNIKLENLITDLIIVLIFKRVIDAIPDFVESIAPSIYNPLSSASHILWNVNAVAEGVVLAPMRPVSNMIEAVDSAIRIKRGVADISSKAYKIISRSK